MITYKGLMWIGIYLIGINLYAWLLMWFDKRSAEAGKWRIAEKQLAIAAALGGVPGALAGMVMFRHKTKHRSFYIGLPILMLLQTVGVIVLLIFLVNKG